VHRFSKSFANEAVEDSDDGQGVAVFVKHAPATKAACHRGLPPEYALAPVARRAQNQPMHLVEELPLPLGCFRKWRRLAIVLSRNSAATGLFLRPLSERFLLYC